MDQLQHQRQSQSEHGDINGSVTTSASQSEHGDINGSVTTSAPVTV
jgi:hypothetical protein